MLCIVFHRRRKKFMKHPCEDLDKAADGGIFKLLSDHDSVASIRTTHLKDHVRTLCVILSPFSKCQHVTTLGDFLDASRRLLYMLRVTADPFKCFCAELTAYEMVERLKPWMKFSLLVLVVQHGKCRLEDMEPSQATDRQIEGFLAPEPSHIHCIALKLHPWPTAKHGDVPSHNASFTIHPKLWS